MLLLPPPPPLSYDDTEYFVNELPIPYQVSRSLLLSPLMPGLYFRLFFVLVFVVVGWFFTPLFFLVSALFILLSFSYFLFLLRCFNSLSILCTASRGRDAVLVSPTPPL